MYILNILSRLFIISMLATSVYAQQQFTQTVTAQNKNCNATCSVIDIPELNNNPGAVVFITPSGGTSNPHPIGAYYMYLNRWSVYNLDAVALPVGATFKVEYDANPDATHFVYSLPPRVHLTEPAYIDNAGLNNNLNAQIRVCPHVSATIGNIWNKLDVKVEYDHAASKWFIANVNNTPISPTVAYNIAFSTAITVTNPNAGRELGPNVATPIPQDCRCSIPTSLSPKGTAGGDLGGSYPAPRVVALQGKPVTDVQPKLGQVLRWALAGWEPADETTLTVTPTPNGNNSMATAKSYYRFLTPDYTWAAGSGYEATLPGMSIQITITTPSIVNVSVIAQTIVTTDCGVINNCGGQGTGINLYRDNTLLVKTLRGGSNDSVTQVLPNYPDLLNPGTYTYKVFGRRIYSNSNIKYLGASNPDESFKSYLSIQVFPQ